MAKCDFCGKPCDLPYKCRHCGGKYCPDCRLPENHNCGIRHTWTEKTKPISIPKIRKQRRRRKHSFSYLTLALVVVGISIFILVILNIGLFSFYLGKDNSHERSLQDNINPEQTKSKEPIIVPTQTNSILQSTTTPTTNPTTRVKTSNSENAPKISPSLLEQQIHNLINLERKNQRLSSLAFDSTLATIARKHSQDMARNNFFSHDNLQGQDPTARGNQAGYTCTKNYGTYYTYGIAENIFQNNLYTSVTYYNGIPVYDWSSSEEIAQSTVSGWMSSSGHRKNILTSTYDCEGIGIAISSNDKVYITQDFC